MVGIIATYVFTVPMSYLVGIDLGYGLIGVWGVFILDEVAEGQVSFINVGTMNRGRTSRYLNFRILKSETRSYIMKRGLIYIPSFVLMVQAKT